MSRQMTGAQIVTVAVGGLAAAVFGVLAIRMFVHMLREKTFPRFAYYVGPLGLLVLIWTMIG